MKQEHGGNGTQKFGMVIDLDLCTGCGSCMVACMAENNVPFREDETDKLKSITWMRVYKLTNGKPYPETDICYLPRPCQHCEGPARTFAVCFGLPGNGHRLRQPDRNRQPDLYPVFRVPVLHGRLPLSCPVFQLVRPDLAGGHGKISEPERLPPDAGGG